MTTKQKRQLIRQLQSIARTQTNRYHDGVCLRINALCGYRAICLFEDYFAPRAWCGAFWLNNAALEDWNGFTFDAVRNRRRAYTQRVIALQLFIEIVKATPASRLK